MTNKERAARIRLFMRDFDPDDPRTRANYERALAEGRDQEKFRTDVQSGRLIGSIALDAMFGKGGGDDGNSSRALS